MFELKLTIKDSNKFTIINDKIDQVILSNKVIEKDYNSIF
jgi:hypothetical protein